MRKHERHKLEVQVEIALQDAVFNQTEYLRDISVSGLCFRSKISLKEKTKIKVKIPLTRPVFNATGVVNWCKKIDDYYEIGIEFIQTHDKFKLRMIEQVCLIENYKKEVFKKEGRILTGEQAAIEWIKKHAHDFDKKIINTDRRRKPRTHKN